jgi:hypothetical protein
LPVQYTLSVATGTANQYCDRTTHETELRVN